MFVSPNRYSCEEVVVTPTVAATSIEVNSIGVSTLLTSCGGMIWEI